MLALFGGRDRWIPVDRSVVVWRAELTDRLSTAIVPEAGHSLTTSCDPYDPEERGPLHDAYERTLETSLRWVLTNGALRAPMSSPARRRPQR